VQIQVMQRKFCYLYSPLRKLLTISLLTLYLNSYTEVHELFRLPILLEHFSEHKQLVSDLTFWDFLVMHYKTDVNHDSTDDQLPFKVPGHSFTALSIALPAQKINLSETPLTVAIKHLFDYKESYFGSSLDSIFQPPRS